MSNNPPVPVAQALEGEWIPSDRPFRVGDYVSRDGTDVHRVVYLQDDFQCGEFECVIAPATGWIKVGETEFNLTRRYEKVARPDRSACPQFGDPS